MFDARWLDLWNVIGWTRLGLALNFVGTLMVAFSFGKNLGDAHQYDHKGRKIYLASFLYPNLFWWGLALLALGFLLQIFDG